MENQFMETYKIEICVILAALFCAVASAAAGAAGLFGGNTLAATIWLAIALLGIGFVIGSLLRQVLDRKPVAERDARIAELEQRPTSEAHAALAARAEAAEAELASTRDALSEMTETLAERTRERDDAVQERDRASLTANLDQFSDFQLLGLCDICDAEAETGYLSRAYGDPAMEQLLALDAVTFDAVQDDAGGRKELRWTLKPEWRQAVRAHRGAIDQRTRLLRERRDIKAAGER